MTKEQIERECRDITATWMGIMRAIRVLEDARDPARIEVWAQHIASMRDDPTVRWPSPMPGWPHA